MDITMTENQTLQAELFVRHLQRDLDAREAALLMERQQCIENALRGGSLDEDGYLTIASRLADLKVLYAMLPDMGSLVSTWRNKAATLRQAEHKAEAQARLEADRAAEAARIAALPVPPKNLIVEHAERMRKEQDEQQLRHREEIVAAEAARETERRAQATAEAQHHVLCGR
jgi:hypothetical protein